MSNIAIDITGQRFGRLVVIARAPRIEPGVRWNCRCDCGATNEVRGTVLRAGQVKSCGCLRRDRAEWDTSPSNLVGRKFGRLTVLRVEDGTERRSWRCSCICGKQTVVRTGLLVNGNTKSCGCGQAPRRAA